MWVVIYTKHNTLNHPTMKKMLSILLVLTLLNCSTDDDSNYTGNQDNPEATILGRWILPGFEDTIRYEFTPSKRFDIYAIDGTFPTLAEFNAQNPQLTGLDWYYEGDKIIVDLNFGNLQEFTPQFVCNNNVVQLLDSDSNITGAYYREGFDYSTCN